MRGRCEGFYTPLSSVPHELESDAIAVRYAIAHRYEMKECPTNLIAFIYHRTCCNEFFD